MKKIKIANIVAYSILIVLIFAISPFVLPKLFGFEIYGILSDSMEPSYPVGSIIYVKKYQASEIEKGDVITFKQGVSSDHTATHRVVENNQKNSTFITRGDNNEDLDALPIAYERLLGKVERCIPFLGTVYIWLVSSAGVAVCTFSALMVIVLWFFVYYWKKR